MDATPDYSQAQASRAIDLQVHPTARQSPGASLTIITASTGTGAYQRSVPTGDSGTLVIDTPTRPQDDAGMQSELARLKASVEYIQGDLKEIKTDIRQVRGDVRTQLYWVIGGFAALLIVLAKGFKWI